MARVLVALSLALLAGGCGGGGGKTPTRSAPPAADDPVSVAQRYVDALGSSDYATDCKLISENTMLQVTQNGKIDCAKQFGKVIAAAGSAQKFFQGAKVTAPKVKGNNATVVVTSSKGKTIQLPLVRENGAWKVST